jgi:hypothetical protein
MANVFRAGVRLAVLALVISGCGSNPAPAPAAPAGTQTCTGVKGTHHAWLVVQHLNGAIVRKCVGFDSDELQGLDLMRSSGIQFQTQHFTFGDAVCQIDNEPAQYSQCLPANAPYWAMFVEAASGWQTPETGVSDVKLRDHGALGWRYTQPSASPAPPPVPPSS